MTTPTLSETPVHHNVNLHQLPSSPGALPQEPTLPPRSRGPLSGPRPEHYQRIWLDGTETTADLRARGVPERTARTAVKRGWYTRHYHHAQYPQDEGPGQFATLTNPYAFVTAQVRHVLRTEGWGALSPEDFDDAVQDALLWAWERRHCAHIADYPRYISVVIQRKLRRRGRRT